jgi:hypothetical protein
MPLAFKIVSRRSSVSATLRELGFRTMPSPISIESLLTDLAGRA